MCFGFLLIDGCGRTPYFPCICCMYMTVWVCVQVGAFVHMHTSVWRPEVNVRCFPFPPYLLKQGLPLNLGGPALQLYNMWPFLCNWFLSFHIWFSKSVHAELYISIYFFLKKKKANHFNNLRFRARLKKKYRLLLLTSHIIASPEFPKEVVHLSWLSFLLPIP